MFIPLHDANSLKHIRLQYVTLGLIAANVVVYAMTALGTQQFSEAAVWGLGYIPSTVFNIAARPPHMVLVPDNATYVTYAFLHSGFMHLLFNMLLVLHLGREAVERLGQRGFLLLYLLSAAGGAVEWQGEPAGTCPAGPCAGPGPYLRVIRPSMTGCTGACSIMYSARTSARSGP